MDDEWNEEQLEAPDSPNIIEDQDEASSHKRSRESSESAPNEPEKRNEDNTEQGANDSAQTLKKIKYAAVMEPVYRYREQCYRQAYALQMQRQQASIQRFNTNVVKHIDSMNRICQTWRPKVVATTEAFLNRFNKSKRERLKLEESLNHRFMIVGYRPLESRVLLSRTKTDQSDQSSRLGDIDNNDEEQWKDECLLIPIRIEVEAEGQRFRDTFTWNAYENVMSPEDFASILCNDFRLNQSQFMPLIAEQIHQQIEDFFHFSTGVCEKQELFSKLVQLDQQMLTSFLQTVINTPDSNSVDWKALQSNYKLTHFERELLERLTAICQSNGHIISAATIPRLFEQPGELRCPIRIRVIVNDLQLLDAVEIDLLSTPFRSQQPEMVAHSICSDLGLGGEFITAVAHQIREQMWLYLKCLQVIGYPLDGSPILDEELGQHFMPPVVPEQEASNADKSSVIRPVDDREQWIPEYYTLSEAEMEKLEKAKERESRRKRRGARGKRAAAEQVDMFGFGLPGDSQQQSTTLSVTATGTGTATNDSDGEFGVQPVSTAPPKVFDRSAIILPDMSEPPKSRRSQLNVHLLPRLRQQAAAGGPTQPLLATTISIAPADQQLQHQSTGRKSGRKAAAQALQNISAIQKEETVLDNDEMQRQQFQFQQQQQVNAYWSNIQAMQMQKQQQLQQQQEFQRSQSPQFMSQMMSQQQQQQLQHNPEFLRQFQHRQVLLMQQRQQQQQQQQQQNRSNSPYQ